MDERTKQLAEEAGCFQGMWTTELMGGEIELERFAELVRQEEREACAKVCEADQFEIIEDESCNPYNRHCLYLAKAIRSRSNHD